MFNDQCTLWVYKAKHLFSFNYNWFPSLYMAVALLVWSLNSFSQRSPSIWKKSTLIDLWLHECMQQVKMRRLLIGCSTSVSLGDAFPSGPFFLDCQCIKWFKRSLIFLLLWFVIALFPQSILFFAKCFSFAVVVPALHLASLRFDTEFFF